MIVVAGLGNPGKQYERTKHNIGFRIVSKLAEKHNISGQFSSQFNAITGKGCIKKVNTIIVEPLTFMNLSGFSILKILNWYKIETDHLIVVYDDIDLKLGTIRFRTDGSAGGHNGIKSIIEHLGENKPFNRLRVGIGPGPNGEERRNFVLKPFLTEQEKLVSDTINLAVEGIECYINKGIQSAMNKYNGIDLTRPVTKSKQKGKVFIDPILAKVEIHGSSIVELKETNIKNSIYPVDLLKLKKDTQSG